MGKQKIIWSYQVINHALNHPVVIKMLMNSNSAAARRNYSRSGSCSWAQYFAISVSCSGRKIQRNISWTQRRNVIDLLML